MEKAIKITLIFNDEDREKIVKEFLEKINKELVLLITREEIEII